MNIAPKEAFELLKEKVRKKLGITGACHKKESHFLLRTMNIDHSLGSGNIIAAGEVAGFISPSIGEGISFSLRSGKNCVNGLNSDLNNPIEKYQKLSAPTKKSKIL